VDKKTFGIVATTIYDGDFINAYRQHFAARNELDQVRLYVIADVSTSTACEVAAQSANEHGFDVVYASPQSQTDFLCQLPAIAAEIPWKSDNRRNVGFLMAYHDKCDIVIAIDDDNYPKEHSPFLQGHSVVGKRVTLPCALGHNGWFNLCSMMRIECPPLGGGETVYARGFPYARRNIDCGKVLDAEIAGTVAVNAGLWSGDPDVDAATRLVTRCEAKQTIESNYLLAEQTLMPINTQNTALNREAIPAYYYVKMGHPVGGMKLDRFGDIFSGFFVQKCVQAVGHAVRVGSPIVDHRRSPHNLYKDLWNELAGMVLIDDMLPLLETPLTPCSDYQTASLELADSLERWAFDQTGFLWDKTVKNYFRNVAANMRLWINACRALA
jgi:hypothetical protein